MCAKDSSNIGPQFEYMCRMETGIITFCTYIPINQFLLNNLSTTKLKEKSNTIYHYQFFFPTFLFHKLKFCVRTFIFKVKLIFFLECRTRYSAKERSQQVCKMAKIHKTAEATSSFVPTIKGSTSNQPIYSGS